MSYRGVSPLVCGEPVMVDAVWSQTGGLDCCVREANGVVTMTAEVTV